MQIDFKELRHLINRLPEARFRVERELSNATRTTQVLTDMPISHGNSESIQERSFDAYTEAKRKRDEIKKQIEAYQMQIARYVGKIDSPLQRSVIRERYFEQHTVREIAVLLNYSEQHIFRVIDRAEKRINEIAKDESCES